MVRRQDQVSHFRAQAYPFDDQESRRKQRIRSPDSYFAVTSTWSCWPGLYTGRLAQGGWLLKHLCGPGFKKFQKEVKRRNSYPPP
jgi:hypothetical protein